MSDSTSWLFSTPLSWEEINATEPYLLPPAAVDIFYAPLDVDLLPTDEDSDTLSSASFWSLTLWLPPRRSVQTESPATRRGAQDTQSCSVTRGGAEQQADRGHRRGFQAQLPPVLMDSGLAAKTDETRGYVPQYKLYLRTAFALGVELPLGTNSDFMPQDTLAKWVEQMRFALAYAERKEGRDVEFKKDVVEADGSSFLKHAKTSDPTHLNRRRMKKPAATKQVLKKSAKPKMKARGTNQKIVHHGRFLVMTGRESNKTVLLPTRAKTTAKGAPPLVESKEEVLKAYEKHVVADTCLAAHDSARSLVAASAEMGMPAATARHSVDEMTPVKKHKLSKLTDKQKKLVKQLSTRKQPAAVLTPRTVAVVGGDNKAEAQFSAVKRIMRKQNLLGRTSPKMIDYAVLATQRLRRQPGYWTVLKALAVYRRDRVHELGHAPHEFLEPAKDIGWLKL
ncbi:hypothetical protein AK812_SmicGene35560 [Symbiodinium microadriaticum]|uniref:Uncharacterized protein n=1 Tax=Symbiodinium microadriaticum TaxID=2951 RepID=A0A1Q9CL62_SYMMI|nr:hypothetical protein AK812_SmicGene35560 [Symbiodinium microadriaticum]